MSLNEKQADVLEFLTGTHELEYDFAKEIAIVTYGDMDAAIGALTLYKLGWSEEEVLKSIRK
ncbi:hypothetical protein HUB98_05765 [Paenibacillus barcinonensis]|uniref:Uncharacterized protein n=1 Tax=Paenibacillus barcinonensis TaxID=198119 RepID=A0A2V4VEK6_PAEBA|nr:hypothetical protein [Paenibacillus barcinonensis]PYE51504.1 hypothetical protein DFQ00_102298 [Paenibacillus barcinonensis]QKS55887.1 hypothetical protein HUB98_05765 [Paenibacillus barcinonensis]